MQILLNEKKWENSFYTHVTEYYASYETIRKFGHFWKEKMGGGGGARMLLSMTGSTTSYQ